MSNDRNDESIFSEALRKGSSQERAEFLDAACGSDAERRRRIEELLASHAQSNSLLDRDLTGGFDGQGLVGSTIDAKGVLGSKENQVVGRYRLLHLLGEGGMGSVYMAEQQQPVKRRVAVKIIKQGMNTEQFIARFEAERQALAMMDHPNIAKVLDAGCTDSTPTVAVGKATAVRPFFVMELVKGVPITEFCDQNKLKTEERLELFVQVCNAVQHAHQKGIIHRDLKPSNVMVAMYDDKPVPKVIDFGVAKATHQPLTEQTLYTVPGQIVGTWEYMSPEQAILNQLDVDTRTDIYSLGVILYELLTGETPLDLNSLRPEALEERLRRIREQEPSRPSLKVSSLGERAGSLAAYRSTQANTLTQSLRGDLDWIVMKAIEKDRSRRYETANGFAAEIRRFLNDEPISFRPPSSWEQLARLHRRHRVVANAVICCVLALSVGLVLALLSLNEANRQREQAEQSAEDLKAEQSAKDQLLNRLALELIEKALIHAQNADFVNMQSSLAAALEAGAPRESENILLGQYYLYGEDTGEAIRYLESAVEQNPKNVAANGMLATAYMFHGYYEKFVEQIDLLKTLPHENEFDQLFAGAGLTMQEDPSALGLVQGALSKRLMPLGLAIEAQTLGHVALDDGKPELAAKAIQRIRAAREFLPDNKFVRMIEVSLHHTAFNLGVENIDQEAVRKVIDEAGDMGSYSIGHFVNAMSYSDLGDRSEAEAAYLAASEMGHWWGIPVWELISYERFEEAQAFLERMRRKTEIGKSTKDTATLWLQIVSGQSIDRVQLVDLAKRFHHETSVHPESGLSRNSNSRGLELLLLAGFLDEARDIYRDTEVVFDFDQEAVPYCLNVDYQDVRIQQLIKSSNAASAQLHYTYGLIELAKGNRERAESFFDMSIQSKFFFYEYYHKARALARLLKNGRRLAS